MLFSFLKLKALANLKPSIQPDDLAKAFNALGFEVEGTRKWGEWSGLKFGEVLATRPNPHGSNLTICDIKFLDRTRVIQTAAKNVRPGMMILAFVPGSKSGAQVFAAKELRQVVSEGMLASFNELGFKAELLPLEWQDTIAEFPDAKLTTNFIDYLGLDDVIFDLKILSNRADANAYYVMAAELAAYFGGHVTWPKRKHGAMVAHVKPIRGVAKALTTIEAKNDFKLSLHDRLLLVKSGFKLVNDAVDLGNLTFIMTGQPVHVYDASRLGQNITAAMRSGDIKVLGNKDVTLNDDLTIVSKKQIVAVAGVIGLASEAVSASAAKLVYELGQFEHKHVRKAVRSARLATQASAQSGRELSPGLISIALDFLTNHFVTFSAPHGEPRFTPRAVRYSAKSFARLVGKPTVRGDEQYQTAKVALERLGFVFKRASVLPPRFMHGINLQQDLDEELMRFYGYDNLQPTPPHMVVNRLTPANALKVGVMRAGFQEVITYSLVRNASNAFNPHHFKQTYHLSPVLSSEHEVMRHALTWSLLDLVSYHDKRKINFINFFEVARLNDGVEVLGLVSTTRSFEDLKEVIVNLLGEGLTFKRATDPFLHPGVSSEIYRNDERVGFLGKVHPAYRTENAMVAELKMLRPVTRFHFEPYDQAPLKVRDVTLVLGKHEDLESKLARLRNFGEFMELRVIDSFAKDNHLHVTVRLAAEEAVIKLVDESYNETR